MPISPNTIIWLVNDIAGGNAGIGMISPTGLNQSPAAFSVIIRATSVADALAFAEATITLTQPPVVVLVSPAAATVQLDDSKAFNATVTGNANTAVRWSVSGDAGDGVITAGGAKMKIKSEQNSSLRGAERMRLRRVGHSPQPEPQSGK